MPHTTDDKFLQEKDSLVKKLEEIAEFLGDEDAKKVTLSHTILNSHVSAESANCSTSLPFTPAPETDAEEAF